MTIKFFTVLAAVLCLLGLMYFRLEVVPKTLQGQKHLIDFKRLKTPSSPNFYLSCPKDTCPNPDANSPIFNCSQDALIHRWQQIVKNQQLTLLDSGVHKARFYALSRIFHFPDLIDVQFYSLAENKATLAIYSHALFGYSDFGVNKKRVLTIIRELQNDCK